MTAEMATVMIVFLSMGSLLWNDLPDRTNPSPRN